MPTFQDLILGLQHIGIPTHSLEKTIDFYQSLGFSIIQAPLHDHKRVAFLKLGDVVIEAYESDETAAHTGAIDHFALNVSDIQAVHSLVRSLGYQELENGIQTLPFFSHGVSYFTIQGPNAEKVEFAQYL
ncbi:MAG: VOC family protein [Sphaerochaeta sp.]|nr:VOC family protein [Sphaerochaeta sp.]HAP57284.1 glyoxalase/bleomycin resistance/extradiol dioxygenase family protein [Sphaerochaeta sp.]